MQPVFTKKITLIIFTMTIGFMILGTFWVNQDIKSLLAANSQVMHTHIVIGKLNNILLNIIDAHDQAERYLSSNDENFLKKYYKIQTDASHNLTQLRDLIKTNFLQQQHFSLLEPTYNAYILSLERLIKKYQATHQSSTVKLEMQEAHTMLDKIKISTKEMSDVEFDLLQERNAKVVSDSKRINFMIITVGSLSNLLLLLCFILLTYQERVHLDVQYKINKELEKTNKRMLEINRLKEEFLANMSHELNTPLNAVIGFSQLLYHEQAGKINGEQKELLQQILGSAKDLLNLIQNVLDFAKVESGNIELNPEEADLQKTLDNVIKVFDPLLKRKKITLSARITKDMPVVYTDLERFKQVLYNYLSNAVKFTLNGGNIQIIISPESKNMFRLEVKDTGIGLRPDDLEKLFIKFQQLDSSSSKEYSGAGVGLALTKKIVEAQGGRVGVESVLDEGSTFYAILPIKPLTKKL